MQTIAWGDASRFELDATSRFSVLISCKNHNCTTYHPFNGSLEGAGEPLDAVAEGIIRAAETGGTSRSSFGTERITSNGGESFSSNLSVHGCCIVANFFDAISVRKVELSLLSVIRKLQKRYDRITDDFYGML